MNSDCLHPLAYGTAIRLPEHFTDPFRYAPHALVREAAAVVMQELESWGKMPEDSQEYMMEHSFAEGKMLGVLIVTPDHHLDSSFCRHKEAHFHAGRSDAMQETAFPLYFLAAFSGTAGHPATYHVPGFVPPLLDLAAPEGYFKQEEARISEINRTIAKIETSQETSALHSALSSAIQEMESEIRQMKDSMAASRKRREEIRASTSDCGILAAITKESQFEKAELKRLKDRWKAHIKEIEASLAGETGKLTALKQERSHKSDRLQKWIFGHATVHNALGDVSSIAGIFERQGLVPPGGTGECAAPKLLEYAYRNGLHPIAMGEFWYGASPDTAVRSHGHFYPSCTSKCGPLLSFMLQGLVTERDARPTDKVIKAEAKDSPVLLYEDDEIIAVEKPSGIPSVPGLDGRLSLQEWLSRHYRQVIHTVHRLDMDTSGVMLFTKTEKAARELQRQFEERTIQKTYKARLTASDSLLKVSGMPAFPTDKVPQEASRPITVSLKPGDTGRISLPLSPDYDERPRQKADIMQGKEAVTDYEVTSTHPDGTIEITFRPATGRTHQLRVHSAHILGLGRPIIGDLLYGAHTVIGATARHSTPQHPTPTGLQTSGVETETPSRLCLHALSISFRHPSSDLPMTIASERLSY